MKISLLPGWGLGLAHLQPLADILSRQHEVQLVPLPECTSLEQALDELDAQIAADSWLAGWSLGGMLATALARRRGGDCPGLVTLGSNACFVARDDWPHAMPKPDFNRFSRRAARDWAGTLRRFELLCLQGEETGAAGSAGEALQAFARPASAIPVLHTGVSPTGMEIAGSSPAMTGDAPPNPVVPGLAPGTFPTGKQVDGSSPTRTGDASPNPVIPVPSNLVIPGLDPGISSTRMQRDGSSMADDSAPPANADTVTESSAQAASLAWLAQLDNRPAIADLRCPQLHLLAEQDALVPVAVADALRRLNPQAQVDVQPGSHAFILIRYRDVAERMLAFMVRSQGRKASCR